jgi:hypothetical protein
MPAVLHERIRLITTERAEGMSIRVPRPSVDQLPEIAYGGGTPTIFPVTLWTTRNTAAHKDAQNDCEAS